MDVFSPSRRIQPAISPCSPAVPSFPTQVPISRHTAMASALCASGSGSVHSIYHAHIVQRRTAVELIPVSVDYEWERGEGLADVLNSELGQNFLFDVVRTFSNLSFRWVGHLTPMTCFSNGKLEASRWCGRVVEVDGCDVGSLRSFDGDEEEGAFVEL